MRNPIDLFLEAKEELRAGNREAAAGKLAAALGSREITPPISGALDRMLAGNSLAHEVAIGLMSFEANRARKSNGSES